MKKFLAKIALLSAVLLLTGQGCVSITGNSEESTNGPAGVFISQDRGESWQSISLMPQTDGTINISSASVYKLIGDPKDPDALYWASRAKGLFYSFDAGRSWQRPSEAVNTGFIYSIAVHPQDNCTVYATNGVVVYRTTNCNRTWAEVYRENESDTLRSVVINPGAPHEVLILKEKGDLLISRDAGISWELQNFFQRQRMADLFIDPQTPGRLYAASKENGLYRSDDLGLNWTGLNADLSDFAGGLEYRRLLVYPSTKDLLYYVSTYGIHRSVDAGESWEALELIHPPGSARIYGFDVSPENQKELYYTATINNRSTFYKSIDEGESWITKKLPSGQIPTALKAHPTNPDWVYLGFTIPPEQ